MNKVQIINSRDLAVCPTRNMLPSHWSHYDEDGLCNHGRLCGYTDEFGGPCLLAVDNHRKDRRGRLHHDDGKRGPLEASIWVR